MTALILARSLIEQGVEITLVESPTVGHHRRGRGLDPWLRGSFDSLGIEEAEWMPECHATYKCGITFDGWFDETRCASYFHPFASMLDNLTMTQFVSNTDARIRGADVCADPDRFSSRPGWRRKIWSRSRRNIFPSTFGTDTTSTRFAGSIPAQEGACIAASAIKPRT